MSEGAKPRRKSGLISLILGPICCLLQLQYLSYSALF